MQAARDFRRHKWKAKYDGMEASDARRLKALEDENRRLKKLLAEAMLDNAALKYILGKTAKACGTTAGGGARYRAARVQSAPRVQADRNRSFGFALSQQASGRQAVASAPTRVGLATPPLRLSAVGLAAYARG